MKTLVLGCLILFLALNTYAMGSEIDPEKNYLGRVPEEILLNHILPAMLDAHDLVSSIKEIHRLKLVSSKLNKDINSKSITKMLKALNIYNNAVEQSVVHNDQILNEIFVRAIANKDDKEAFRQACLKAYTKPEVFRYIEAPSWLFIKEIAVAT